jgi:hypothetical protein
VIAVSARSGVACREERHAAALAAQIELSLRESAVQVEGLAAALGRMSARLVALKAGAEAPGGWSGLSEELNTCMLHLQFYDRMVQHLTHLRDFLLSVADGGDDAEVVQRLRQHLVSNAQRELLDLLLPSAQGASAGRDAPRPAAPADDIELF